MFMSRIEADRMGRNSLYAAIAAVLAIFWHAYYVYKAPKTYWRVAKWFWYFFAVCILIVCLDQILYKAGWLHGVQEFFKRMWMFVLPAGFAWFCATPYFVSRAKLYDDWIVWPTFEEYCLSREIDRSTMNNIKCEACGNQSIRNIGFGKESDNRRLHVCNQCSAGLYRSQQG